MIHGYRHMTADETTFCDTCGECIADCECSDEEAQGTGICKERERGMIWHDSGRCVQCRLSAH